MSNPSVSIDLLLQDAQFKAKLSGILSHMSSKLNKVSKGSPFKSLTSGAQSFATGATRIVGSLTSILKKMGLITGAAGAGAVALSAWAAKSADDVERAGWKFDIVFKKTTASSTAMAAGIAQAYGRHISTIQTSMSRIGDILKPAGVAEGAAATMSAQLTELAQGAKEWTDGQYDAKTASIAMAKALVGEREMLKEMGVIIREQDVAGYVKEMGWAYNEANKMAATFNMILERSPDMQKAAGSRMNSFSERTKQASESVKGLGNAFGQFLGPTVKESIRLFETVSDKAQEFLFSGEASGLHEQMMSVARAINDISQAIGKMPVGDLQAKLASMLSSLGKYAWDMFGIFLNKALGALPTWALSAGKAIFSGIGEMASPYFNKWISMFSEAWMRTIGDKNLAQAEVDFQKAMDAQIATRGDWGAAFSARSKQLVAEMTALTAGLSGGAAGAKGRNIRTSPMGELSNKDSKIGTKLDKLKKEQERATKAFKTSMKRETELRTRRGELQAKEEDRTASITGMREVWSQIATGVMGKKTPDQQVARNTRQIAEQASVQTKAMQQIEAYQKEIVELTKKKDSQARFGP